MSSAQNRRLLTRKSSNIENVVPRTNKTASVNRSGLHRIRRKVSGVKPYAFAANTSEHQMKKRLLKTRASRQGVLLTPPATPEVQLKATPPPASPSKLQIPRILKRPPTRAISVENLASILPMFENTPLPFIRDTLQEMGDPMQRVLAGVQSTIPDAKVLPKQIDITLNNLDAGAPTHMLAIYPRTTSATPTKVTLIPVHNIVLAAHCAHLPKLPPTIPNTEPVTVGSTITVPVVPYPIPEPELFPLLLSYLYNKRHERVLSQLFPCRPPTNAADTTAAQRQLRFATLLAQTYTTTCLVSHIMKVNALWRNVCALGIFDANLWRVMDAAWEIYLSAIALSTGKYKEFTNGVAV